MSHRFIQIGEFFIELRELAIKVVQWIWIISMGLLATLNIDYAQDMHQILITTVSMAVATLVSWRFKRLLNNKKETIMNTLRKIYLGNPKFTYKQFFAWIVSLTVITYVIAKVTGYY